MTARDTATAEQTDLTALDGLVAHAGIQGIPTLYSPRQGQITAGLFFRVGRADETLATSGLTHLVEHLALHRLGLSDLHYNGATANTYTLFHVTGDEDEVVAYLNGVCAALRDLPLDRRRFSARSPRAARTAPPPRCRCGVTAHRATACPATTSSAPGA
ncbi:hypothetical protein [Streptomyces sp. NPDC002671]